MKKLNFKHKKISILFRDTSSSLYEAFYVLSRDFAGEPGIMA
jgi:hypothetical protein